MSSWIKMDTGLRDHPKVVRMAGMLKSDCLRVVGALHAVWSLFDEHSPSGLLEFYTARILDDKIGWRGFCQAMQTVGWLIEDANGLTVPDYEEHNGPTAKRRASETKRKAESREACGDDRTKAERIADKNRTESGQMSASDADKKRAREEKRREEPIPSEPDGSGASPPLSDRDRVWLLGPALLGEGARGLLGKLAKSFGEGVLADVLAEATRDKPIDPKAWVTATCTARAKPKAANGHAYEHEETAEEAVANPRPAWALNAGFPDRFQAENAGCTAKNAHRWRDGGRVA